MFRIKFSLTSSERVGGLGLIVGLLSGDFCLFELFFMIDVLVVAENRQLTKCVCNRLKAYPDIKVSITHYSINVLEDIVHVKPNVIVLDAHVISSVEYVVQEILHYEQSMMVIVINGVFCNRFNLKHNVINLPDSNLSALGELITNCKNSAVVKSDINLGDMILADFSAELFPLFIELFSCAIKGDICEIDRIVRDSVLKKYMFVDDRKVYSHLDVLENFAQLFLNVTVQCNGSLLLKYDVDNIKFWFVKLSDALESSRFNELTKSCLCYMVEHYREPVYLHSVADMLCVSKYYLSRIIKSETNKTFNENLNFLRMFIASQYLYGSDMSITFIANQVGFSDSLYFSRQFKKYHGQSPKRFRELMRSNDESINQR